VVVVPTAVAPAVAIVVAIEVATVVASGVVLVVASMAASAAITAATLPLRLRPRLSAAELASCLAGQSFFPSPCQVLQAWKGNIILSILFAADAGPRLCGKLLPEGTDIGSSVSPKHIFDYFNPSDKDYNRGFLGTINASEQNPNGVAYSLIFVDNQPHWMSENIVYIKSRLTLLPEYAENKATLLKLHNEPSHEEVMKRLTAKLTETIMFRKYGIEDGPDMELFDEEGSISSLIVPGDWMPKAHELPRIAAVDTPSVKYRPAAHKPIAVYAGYGNTPDATGFKFIAWFMVEEIELFAAGSLDLARRMHDKKWDADMGREWYVLFKHSIFPCYCHLSVGRAFVSPSAVFLPNSLSRPTEKHDTGLTDW
jgi:hypothetical protein